MTFSLKYNLYDLIDEYNKPEIDSMFGASIDIDNLHIAIGCPHKDISSYSKSGCVYLFSQDGFDNWSFDSIATPSVLESDLYFGSKVSISNNNLVILSTGENNKSRIYLFENQNIGGLKRWIEIDYFEFEKASSLDLKFDYAIVGASGFNYSKGRAVVLKKDKEYGYSLLDGDFRAPSLDGCKNKRAFSNGNSLFDGDWWHGERANSLNCLSLITNVDSKANDFFGKAVSISDNYAVISSSQENNKGAIYIYNKNDNDTWTALQKMVAYGGKELDDFGSSLSNTNNYIIVGAKNKTPDNMLLLSGGSYLLSNNEGRWYFLNEYSMNLPVEGALYGTSVAINDKYIIVGAPESTPNGLIEIYSKDRDWNYIASLANPDDNEIHFGTNIAISKETIIAGGKNDSNVYLYLNRSFYLYLGQEFPINSSFVPSKVSLYFKRIGSNPDSVWRLTKTENLSIDATNFSQLIQKNNKIIFDDSINGYCGNGYMICSPYDELTTIGEPIYSPPSPYCYTGHEQGFTSDSYYGIRTASPKALGNFYLNYPREGKDIIGYNPLGSYLFYDFINHMWVISESLSSNLDEALYYFESSSNIASEVLDANFLASAKYTNGAAGGNFYLSGRNFNNGSLLTDTFGTLKYPIQTTEPGTYYLHLRYLLKSNNNIIIYPHIDDKIIGTINTTLIDSYDSHDWEWSTFSFVIPDNNLHYINIKLCTQYAAIDKLVINTSSVAPVGYGEPFSISPYITTHVKLFNSTFTENDGLSYSFPNQQLFIYDSKSTLEEIRVDNWYNFNIKILDSRLGFTNKIDFPGTYFIVVSTTGSNSKNYIIWEMDNVDEYSIAYCSCIKI